MSLKDTQDLAPSDALHLSNTVRVTKNDTDLWRSHPSLRKFAYVLINLIMTNSIPIQIYIYIYICTYRNWNRFRNLGLFYILRSDLKPTRRSSLVWQSGSWNTLTTIESNTESKRQLILAATLKRDKSMMEEKRYPRLCIRPMVAAPDTDTLSFETINRA